MAKTAALLVLAPLLFGCEGFIGSPEGDDESSICGSETTAPPNARLLTRAEYRNTVFDLLLETEDPTLQFPNEPDVGGYNNNAASHVANPLSVENWMKAAESLAERAKTRGFLKLVPCEGQDEACARSFLATLGKRLFRRPLLEDETESFLLLYETVSATAGHERGLRAVLTALLSSPQFLYRVEAPLPASPETKATLLGPYEMASRLSYFFWGSAPDEELLEVAAAGKLHSEGDVERAARRLLQDPRARRQIREFHSRWLGLQHIEGIARDGAPTHFREDLVESLHLYLEATFWREGGSLEDLLKENTTYLNASLADIYGKVVDQSGFVAVASSERHGLLTQPALMSLFAHPNQSSPIARGVWIRDRILCSPVSPPPPNVNNSPPDPDPHLTTRELFRVHTQNPTCASCHELIDPIGFGFEAYDALGRYRTEENGQPIDTSGALVETGDPEIDGTFKGAAEATSRLAKSDKVLDCLTRQWFTFALGHPPTPNTECSIERAAAHAAAHGDSLQELLIGVATSFAFRYRAPHTSASFPPESGLNREVRP